MKISNERLYIATAVLQGMYASGVYQNHMGDKAKSAVAQADYLIAELKAAAEKADKK